MGCRVRGAFLPTPQAFSWCVIPAGPQCTWQSSRDCPAVGPWLSLTNRYVQTQQRIWGCPTLWGEISPWRNYWRCCQQNGKHGVGASALPLTQPLGHDCWCSTTLSLSEHHPKVGQYKLNQQSLASHKGRLDHSQGGWRRSVYWPV